MKQKLLLKGLCLAFLFITNVIFSQSVFINEFHYDNVSTDEGEAIEIAGPAGTDLSQYSIVLYNGGNNSTYGTFKLNGLIPDQQNGYGTNILNFPENGLQNGAPDGFALVKGTDVIQFLSYEGIMTAANGPAAGMTSQDVGVAEGSDTPAGYSLQLAGEGQDYSQFTWQTEAQNTFANLNNNQSFGGDPVEPQPEPEPEPEPELPPAPAVDVVFMNEIHYDNASGDVGEGVEIAGSAGTDLTGYQILLYNGSATQLKLYNPSTTLSGIIPEQQNGFGTVFFSISGIQNGDPDGIALVDPDGKLLQFLSYGGTFVPSDGPAAGMESIDIGVTQGSSTPIGYSLQLIGEGSSYLDFTWAPEAQNTYGEVNTGQTFISPEPVLFINELHYDNYSTDADEGVEVAGTAGLDLTGYSLVLYNGSASQLKAYKTETLSGIIPNQQKGYGTLFFPISAIQNGDPDGVALVGPEGTLIQFLSYGGTFIPVDGPAAGVESSDIGLTESSSTPAGYSLQLKGVGFNYEDFYWQEAIAHTYGEVNTGQSFGGALIEPEPEPEVPAEPGTIAYARSAEVGTKLTMVGTLTVTDHLGNTAYIQDETGGIAIFGNLVTEAGLYQIGDSLRVTGTRAVYNESVQISDVESVEYLGVANKPIEPKEISISEMENYRGQLVKITDLSFPNPGQLFFGNANYLVTDGAGGTGELRIDSDVSSLVGKLQPEVCEDVVGVVGRYNSINQLLPRNERDLPCAEPYDPTFPGSEISKDFTFDAVTWNIEWFGDEANSPAAGKADSDAIQKEAVKAVLYQLDADVIAVQEISDEDLFKQMVDEMEGYDFILSPATSYPDSPGGQKVGFVYKTETVNVTDTRAMFTTVHPFYDGKDAGLLADYPESPDRFYASGRLPFLMEANVTIDGTTQEMKFVALHARANGSTGAQGRYDMRKYDVEVLKDSIDLYFPNDRVMILGDYNDDVDFTVANVSTTISTFDAYTSDPENYSVLTSVLSEEGYRSYVVGDYNDMIDHIMVTNELEAKYIAGSARVHYELYNADYTYTTSDHLPVSVRLQWEDLKVASIEASSTSCSGTATGSATVNVKGGIFPYSYVWSDGQDGQTAKGLTSGTYTVIVTDYLSNSVEADIVIEEAQPLELIMIEDQSVFVGYTSNCTTLSAASVSGGSGVYTYLWSTGETSETITVCPQETTTYTLTVTDFNGCMAEGLVQVIAEEVSCGIKGDKVQICNNGNSICVAPQAVSAFLRKGAKLGSCDGGTAILIEEVIAYPNPTTSKSNIKITAAKNFDGHLVVYNLNGNRVLDKKISVKEGITEIQINLGNFRQGIYLLKIHGADFDTEALKIVKN